MLVVKCISIEVLCMCPIMVASSKEMNLLVASCVKPGHPWRYPVLVATAKVCLVCNPRLARYYFINWLLFLDQYIEFVLQLLADMTIPLVPSNLIGLVSGMTLWVQSSVRLIYNRFGFCSLQPLCQSPNYTRERCIPRWQVYILLLNSVGCCPPWTPIELWLASFVVSIPMFWWCVLVPVIGY